MRLRGTLLVVLGLLVLGGYVHASLHAMEHAHEEDCALQLFCSGGAPALATPAAETPQAMPALEAVAAVEAPTAFSCDRVARSARGPPRS